jgi:CheY-like chemotaxis protein
VLVISDRHRESEAFRWALRALHLDSVWVRGGPEGLAALRRTAFDLVLVDEHLPDMSGAAVVRALGDEYDRRRFVIVRGAVPFPPAAGMTHADALSVLETPQRCTDVIGAINTILGLSRADGLAPPSSPPIAWMTVGSVADRWARLVLGTIDADCDPKTLTIWARAVGASRSVISECCRLVHVAAHDARDFARVLRVICRSGERWQPEAVLDLADPRTLRKLLARSGLAGTAGRTPTMPQFLEQQRWIPKANAGLVALRSLLFDVTRYRRA